MGEQRPAGPPVSVFTGNRPAVTANQGRRVLHEGLECGNVIFFFQRQVNANMHAAVPEVTVGEPEQVVVRHESFEVLQVGAQVFRRHRSVFPPRPCLVSTWRAARKTNSVSPNPPQRRRFALVLNNA